MLQNNYGHTQFFICNRPTDSSGNNNRSDVENQDAKEVTQPLAEQNRLHNHRYQYVLVKA